MSAEGEGGLEQELSRASERPPSGPLEADPVAQVPAPETPTPEGESGDGEDDVSREAGGIDTDKDTGIGIQQKGEKSPSSISPKATDSLTTEDFESSTATTAGDSSNQTAASSRQVIAVSASKGPAAFFNLARKFLITDEVVDLSALEGAIVSAVDAAHLLERSKLASIIRIHTSYVAVEPKRKRQDLPIEESSPRLEAQTPPHPIGETTTTNTISSTDQQDSTINAHTGIASEASSGQSQQPQHSNQKTRGSPLKRARIIITVKRTQEYKQWLDENPSQDIIAASGGDDDNIISQPSGAPPKGLPGDA